MILQTIIYITELLAYSIYVVPFTLTLFKQSYSDQRVSEWVREWGSEWVSEWVINDKWTIVQLMSGYISIR
jgi:hypothetical protein